MYLLGPAAMAARDICHNCPRLEAFRDDLRLQRIRPALSTHASVHFNTRRQPSYVVRMVVHGEHHCRRRLF
jgi:hypothetical protein